MAIKIRRIEDRTKNVSQLRREETEKKVRRGLLPKLTIVVLVLLFAAALYFIYRPPRIVAPFVVMANPAQITSPVSGTIEWLLEPGATRVSTGDLVARIKPDPAITSSALARLTDLRLRSGSIGSVPSLEASAMAQEAELRREELRLESEADVLGEKIRMMDADLEETHRKLARARENLETAQSLKRLGAITETDYRLADQALAEAGTESQKTESRRRSLLIEKRGADRALEEFRRTVQYKLAEASARIEETRRSSDLLRSATSPMAALLSEEDGMILVKSPTSGAVLDVMAAAHAHLEEGEPLLMLYDPRSMILRAYVPVKFRGDVREGMQARLYMPGRPESIDATVARISRRIEPIPRDLRPQLRDGDYSSVAAEIKPQEVGLEEFLPGETGRAVLVR
jgi:multidrug resistance efflux pump